MHRVTFLAAGGALLVLAAGAQAADGTWFGDQKALGKWTIGLKVGNMVHEADGYKDATNRGVVVGYTFNRPVGPGSASVEFEFTDTFDDGEIDQGFGLGGTGTWQVQTKAVYVAWRTDGTIYFKGKVGAVLADVKERPTDAQELSTDESAIAIGGGVGVRFGGNGSVEFEYTGGQGINDINFASVGAALHF
jgi:hypothetical protein